MGPVVFDLDLFDGVGRGLAFRGSGGVWFVISTSAGFPTPFFAALSFSLRPKSNVIGLGGGGLAASRALASDSLRCRVDFGLLAKDFLELLVKIRLRVPPFSSTWRLSSFSISPSTVLPLIARFSSAIGVYLIIPRSAVTPIASAMNDCTRAVLRLLVAACTCDGRAEMVRMYAGSNEPPSRRQAECVRAIMIDDSGR